MTLWSAVLISSALVYSWKLLGYLVPERFVSNPRIKELAALLTVALLAGLVGIQTFVSTEGISLDARVPALALAGFLFYLQSYRRCCLLAGFFILCLLLLEK